MKAVKTYCVIVAYRPDIDHLHDLCNAVMRDGSGVVVVDNTESPYLTPAQLPAGGSLIRVGYNSGIASAQNRGIAAALEAGAEVVGFFDQDSRIDPGLVSVLASVLEPGSAQIVAPRCVDDSTGAPLPSIRLGRFGRSIPIDEEGLLASYPVDIVISSGTFATKEVFGVAGVMDEGLFIDFVDTEWCLRCRSRGIPIRIIPAVTMRHSVGNRHVRLGPFTVLVHSPTRCYFQIRNSFLLFRKKHIHPLFSFRQTLAVALSRIILLFNVEDGSAYRRAYWSGMRDGLNGVVGARPVE
jgi:rhamnosyltransferase